MTYEPDLPQDSLEQWLLFKMKSYAMRHPRILNYVTNKARVYVPTIPRDTIPEPDLAGYKDFPLQLPIRKRRWQDVSPLIVGEVLSPDDAHKDLIRNVQLYLQVPSIREYWIIDGRNDADRPTMIVYCRRGSSWRRVELQYGDTYVTRLLPGFKLLIDPRK